MLFIFPEGDGSAVQSPFVGWHCGAWVSICVLSSPSLPVLHLFFCCTLWFNIVLLPNFPLLLIVNSWQGLLGELILLQQQIQEHEEEARRAAGQYSTSYAHQKRKVMLGYGGYWCIALISHFCQDHVALICWWAPSWEITFNKFNSKDTSYPLKWIV